MHLSLLCISLTISLKKHVYASNTFLSWFKCVSILFIQSAIKTSEFSQLRKDAIDQKKFSFCGLDFADSAVFGVNVGLVLLVHSNME